MAQQGSLQRTDSPSVPTQAAPSGDSYDPTEAPVEPGHPIHTSNPRIPKDLKGKDVIAVLYGTITSQGNFEDFSVLDGDRGFEAVALDAVKRWRYTPATREGTPVGVKTYVVFRSDHGNIKSIVEPDLPLPMAPKRPLKELALVAVQPKTMDPPRAIFSPDPEYSEAARLAKYQGVVTLGMVIGTDGIPDDVWITKKLGLGLDQKALDAVRQWKFRPAMKDGETVAVNVNVEVAFHLY